MERGDSPSMGGGSRAAAKASDKISSFPLPHLPGAGGAVIAAAPPAAAAPPPCVVRRLALYCRPRPRGSAHYTVSAHRKDHEPDDFMCVPAPVNRARRAPRVEATAGKVLFRCPFSSPPASPPTLTSNLTSSSPASRSSLPHHPARRHTTRQVGCPRARRRRRPAVERARQHRLSLRRRPSPWAMRLPPRRSAAPRLPPRRSAAPRLALARNRRLLPSSRSSTRRRSASAHTPTVAAAATAPRRLPSPLPRRWCYGGGHFRRRLHHRRQSPERRPAPHQEATAVREVAEAEAATAAVVTAPPPPSTRGYPPRKKYHHSTVEAATGCNRRRARPAATGPPPLRRCPTPPPTVPSPTTLSDFSCTATHHRDHAPQRASAPANRDRAATFGWRRPCVPSPPPPARNPLASAAKLGRAPAAITSAIAADGRSSAPKRAWRRRQGESEVDEGMRRRLQEPEAKQSADDADRKRASLTRKRRCQRQGIGVDGKNAAGNDGASTPGN